jgi:hypothetical protein
MESSTGVQLTVEEPVEPFQITSLTLNSCNCSLGINGTNINIDILPEPLIVGEENGSFFVDIALYGFSSSIVEDDIKYTLDIQTSLLLCLNPIPPAGWINLKLDCSLNAFENNVVNYTTTFEISLPITSVED